jgi:uncharacterized membrane protein YsdA (DUF1294 family)
MTVEQYGAYLAFFSILTFAVYVVDKIKAIKGVWRVRESLLLSLSFFGGAVGGYLAMFIARHKIRKPIFHIVNLIGFAWQAILLIVLL